MKITATSSAEHVGVSVYSAVGLLTCGHPGVYRCVTSCSDRRIVVLPQRDLNRQPIVLELSALAGDLDLFSPNSWHSEAQFMRSNEVLTINFDGRVQ